MSSIDSDDVAAHIASGIIAERPSPSRWCYGGILEQVKAFSFAEASPSVSYPSVTLRKRTAPDYDVDEEVELSVLPPPLSNSPRPHVAELILASSLSEHVQSLANLEPPVGRIG